MICLTRPHDHQGEGQQAYCQHIESSRKEHKHRCCVVLPVWMPSSKIWKTPTYHMLTVFPFLELSAHSLLLFRFWSSVVHESTCPPASASNLKVVINIDIRSTDKTVTRNTIVSSCWFNCLPRVCLWPKSLLWRPTKLVWARDCGENLLTP